MNTWEPIEIVIALALVFILGIEALDGYTRHIKMQQAAETVDLPAPNNPADNTLCIDGIARHRGSILIVDGKTVKCGSK